MFKKFSIWLLLLFIISAFALDFSFARGGGGHSHRSSSSRSSSHSSSRSSSHSSSRSSSHSRSHSYSSHSTSYSGSDITSDCCAGIFIIGFILTALIILALSESQKQTRKKTQRNQSSPTGSSNSEFSLKKLLAGQVSVSMPPPNFISNKIENYKLADTNFSRQAFLDFAALLYTRYQDERGKKEFRFTRFFMAPELLDKILSVSSNNIKIDNIIIGAYTITALEQGPTDRIIVRFESNYDKTQIISGEAKIQSFCTVEFWSFIRSSGKTSPEPARLSRLSCPSCGSTQEPAVDGACKYCSHVSRTGDFYWLVDGITIQNTEIKPPIALSSEEPGTDMPTIYQNNMREKEAELKTSDPNFSMNKFRTYAEEIFMKVQEGWTKKQPEIFRPYETDNLYKMHGYWINTYITEHKTNVLEDIRITNIEICRVETDTFYETITMRIYAKMKDYTVNDGQPVTDGSDKIIRSFSEYWTFMRKRGIETKNLSAENCPNCGAALDINAAGVCAYCGSKINSGDFGWVLSMIEQDEVYNG